MNTYDKNFLKKVKAFKFDEAHGFIIDKDTQETDQEIFTEEILDLMQTIKTDDAFNGTWDAIYNAYKLGYMRATGRI